jgi:hypothetical protein
MGLLYLLECQECESVSSWNIGGGFSSVHQNFEYLILNILQGDEREKLFKSLPEGGELFIERTRWSNDTFSCPGCNRISVEISWNLEIEEEEKIRSVHECSDCEVELKHFSAEKIENRVLHPCHKCGNSELAVIEKMMWD